MVDHLEILGTLRSYLSALSVATTGVAELSALSTGYQRVSGSFLVDGFVKGMEVTPEGFANSEPGIIGRVSDLFMEIEGGRIPESSAANRTLKVGLPAKRAWENMPFTPEDRRWYVEEDYLPGPLTRATLGTTAEFDAEPAYVLRLYGLAGRGVSALYRVADAILSLFRPNLALNTGKGHVLRVRSAPGPERSQVLPEGSSHAVIVITVPLWVRTANNI